MKSARFRRRLAWVGASVAVAGAVAFLVVVVGNTGHKVPNTFSAGKPQVVPPAPKPVAFTRAEQSQVRAVAAKFIQTAVYRNHVDDSWAISTPAFHQGLKRSEWAGGQIPVVPYNGDAVAEVRWRLDSSYDRDVSFKVAIYPKPHAGVDRQVFDIELEDHGTAAAPNWLVSYWAPTGGVSLQNAQPNSPEVPATSMTRGRLGVAWLLAPLGVIFGALFGVIVFLAVRGRIRRVRAERAYTSRTSPS
jgi:hypothetical protein